MCACTASFRAVLCCLQYIYLFLRSFVNADAHVQFFRSGVGTAGSLLTLFYVEVTDSQKVSAGGGNPHEGELIEVVDVPTSETERFALDENINRPAVFTLSLLWFEKYKKNRLTQL